MNKQNKAYFYLSLAFAFLCVLSTGIIAAVLVFPSFTIRLSLFITCIMAALVNAVIALFFIAKTQELNEEKKRKITKGMVITFFVCYVVTLITTLLIGVVYANHTEFVLRYNVQWIKDSVVSLIPFKTTLSSFKAVALGRLGLIPFFLNIGGNILLYMPLAFFLPALSKTNRSFDSFLPSIVFPVVTVEVLQAMFSLGSCDIDDFILGAGSACILFFILRAERITQYFKDNYIYKQ